MNYPVWYLPETGGGLLIALIAILHVFVSHFAVGGGLYLIYSEQKGLRENSAAILEFTRLHARFFVLLTLVFGSITGVGIWFIIALVNPAATSFLIHTFVFGWAAEWVFFMVEIVAAFIYYYMFGRMDSATHLKIGWVYFISAWMSLLLINGIVAFMLTPGGWLESGSFWAGFFNPSFFPSLFFRTFVAILLAGVFGCLTSSFTADPEVRAAMTRFSGKWSLAALAGAIPAGIWYVYVLPEPARGLVLGKSPTISAAFRWGGVAVLVLLALVLVANILRPSFNRRGVALVAMAAALVFLGSFEWIREAARRPYAINEVIYSNMIFKDQVEPVSESGFLRTAKWVENRELSEQNLIAAGEELFINQCYACHTVNGFNNDIVSRTAQMSFQALKSYIGRIHQVRYFMPPFVGTEAEAGALAAYIAGGLHGKEVAADQPDSGGTAGAALFEAHCAACHRAEEVGSAFTGITVAEVEEILANLDQISEEMVPFDGSSVERQALARYLHGLTNETGDRQADGALLFEQQCSACHQVEEVAPAFAGLSAEEIVQMLATLEEISEEMVPFEGSREEFAALAGYFQAQNGEAGGSVPGTGELSIDGAELFEFNCAVCHSAETVAGYTAEWDLQAIREALDQLNVLVEQMPPYHGSPEEKDALADYLNSLKGE